MRAALVMLACALPGLCQYVPARPASEYGRFFAQAAQMSRVPTDQLTVPTIQDVLGLNAEEMKIVNAIATDYVEKIQAVAPVSHLVFEARMRTIESGEDSSEWLAQRLKEVDERVDQVVAQHVEKLKAALGEEGFQRVEKYVHSDWIHHCFAARCGDGMVIAVKK